MSGAAILALVGTAAFLWPASAERDTFTVGTAVLVAAYLLFPVFLVLAGGLGLIALLLIVGAAIERRNGRNRSSPPRTLE